jgi:hypothetical protein
VTIQVAATQFTLYDDDAEKTEETLYEDQSDLVFVTSPWSTKCLVLNDFLYNGHSSHGNKQYWRCHNYSRKKKEERCRARCLVSNGKIICLTGGKHNHPPHTEKIQKIFKKEKDRTIKSESF